MTSYSPSMSFSGLTICTFYTRTHRNCSYKYEMHKFTLDLSSCSGSVCFKKQNHMICIFSSWLQLTDLFIVHWSDSLMRKKTHFWQNFWWEKRHTFDRTFVFFWGKVFKIWENRAQLHTVTLGISCFLLTIHVLRRLPRWTLYALI